MISIYDIVDDLAPTVIASGTSSSGATVIIGNETIDVITNDPVLTPLEEPIGATCFSLENTKKTCFALLNDETSCFNYSNESPDESDIDDTLEELDFSPTVYAVWAVHFTSVDKLYVFGRSEGEAVSGLWLHEFAYTKSTTGGVAEVGTLNRKIYITSDTSNDHDAWIISYGSTFTYDLMLHHGNTLFSIDTTTFEIRATKSGASSLDYRQFLAPNEYLSWDNNLDLFSPYWQDGITNACSENTSPLLRVQVYDENFNIVNTQYPFWGKHDSYLVAQWDDSHGETYSVLLHKGNAYDYGAELIIIKNSGVGYFPEDLRQLVPWVLGNDHDVCSFCVTGSTVVRKILGRGVALKTCWFDGRYIGIMSTSGTYFIDTHRFVNWTENVWEDLLVKTDSSVIVGSCMASGWYLVPEASGSKIYQKKIHSITE